MAWITGDLVGNLAKSFADGHQDRVKLMKATNDLERRVAFRIQPQLDLIGIHGVADINLCLQQHKVEGVRAAQATFGNSSVDSLVFIPCDAQTLNEDDIRRLFLKVAGLPTWLKAAGQPSARGKATQDRQAKRQRLDVQQQVTTQQQQQQRVMAQRQQQQVMPPPQQQQVMAQQQQQWVMPQLPQQQRVVAQRQQQVMMQRQHAAPGMLHMAMAATLQRLMQQPRQWSMLFPYLGQAPHAVPGQAPHAVPGQAPHAVPGQAPHAVLGQAPHAVPGQAPHAVPGQAPHAVPGQGPHAVPGQAPHAVPGVRGCVGCSLVDLQQQQPQHQHGPDALPGAASAVHAEQQEPHQQEQQTEAAAALAPSMQQQQTEAATAPSPSMQQQQTEAATAPSPSMQQQQTEAAVAPALSMLQQQPLLAEPPPHNTGILTEGHDEEQQAAAALLLLMSPPHMQKFSACIASSVAANVAAVLADPKRREQLVDHETDLLLRLLTQEEYERSCRDEQLDCDWVSVPFLDEVLTHDEDARTASHCSVCKVGIEVVHMQGEKEHVLCCGCGGLAMAQGSPSALRLRRVCSLGPVEAEMLRIAFRVTLDEVKRHVKTISLPREGPERMAAVELDVSLGGVLGIFQQVIKTDREEIKRGFNGPRGLAKQMTKTKHDKLTAAFSPRHASRAWAPAPGAESTAGEVTVEGDIAAATAEAEAAAAAEEEECSGKEPQQRGRSVKKAVLPILWTMFYLLITMDLLPELARTQWSSIIQGMLQLGARSLRNMLLLFGDHGHGTRLHPDWGDAYSLAFGFNGKKGDVVAYWLFLTARSDLKEKLDAAVRAHPGLRDKYKEGMLHRGQDVKQQLSLAEMRYLERALGSRLARVVEQLSGVPMRVPVGAMHAVVNRVACIKFSMDHAANTPGAFAKAALAHRSIIAPMFGQRMDKDNVGAARISKLFVLAACASAA